MQESRWRRARALALEISSTTDRAWLPLTERMGDRYMLGFAVPARSFLRTGVTEVQCRQQQKLDLKQERLLAF